MAKQTLTQRVEGLESKLSQIVDLLEGMKPPVVDRTTSSKKKTTNTKVAMMLAPKVGLSAPTQALLEGVAQSYYADYGKCHEVALACKMFERTSAGLEWCFRAVLATAKLPKSDEAWLVKLLKPRKGVKAAVKRAFPRA